MDEHISILNNTFKKTCIHCRCVIEANTKHNLNRKYNRHIIKFHETAEYLSRLEEDYNKYPNLFIKYASVIINRHKQNEAKKRFHISENKNTIVNEATSSRKRAVSSNKSLSDEDVEEITDILSDDSSVNFLLNSFLELRSNNVLYSDLHRRSISYNEYDIFLNRIYGNNISEEWKSKVNNKVQKFLRDRDYVDFGIVKITRKSKNNYCIIYKDGREIPTKNLFRSIKDRLDSEE